MISICFIWIKENRCDLAQPGVRTGKVRRQVNRTEQKRVEQEMLVQQWGLHYNGYTLKSGPAPEQLHKGRILQEAVVEE